MVHVVRAVAATASVQTPTRVDRADTQVSSSASAPRGLCACDKFAGVFGKLSPLRKEPSGKATLALNFRVGNGQSGREFNLHEKEKAVTIGSDGSRLSNVFSRRTIYFK